MLPFKMQVTAYVQNWQNTVRSSQHEEEVAHLSIAIITNLLESNYESS